jgi:hypothetical protein
MSANALFLILLEIIRADGRDKFSSHPLETDVLEPKGTSRDGQRTRCVIHCLVYVHSCSDIPNLAGLSPVLYCSLC